MQPLSFHEAANTPALYDAFDKLVGRGRWRRRPNVGTFVVRFPSPADPGDLGWHVDLSFPGDTGDPTGSDYSAWRVNVTSRDRALLMLFLFSDVGEDDAPTRIRVGSHADVAAPAGEARDIGRATECARETRLRTPHSRGWRAILRTGIKGSDERANAFRPGGDRWRLR